MNSGASGRLRIAPSLSVVIWYWAGFWIGARSRVLGLAIYAKEGGELKPVALGVLSGYASR
jgi:hypothetical protein